MRISDWIPIPPFQRYELSNATPDLMAAVAVGFLAVPQGLAYATIAGLPPAMGLYAAAVPTVVGSLFRSSSHVVAGPTNALSLLVGGAAAAGVGGGDPVTVAMTLALMVGLFQAVAGVLRLGAIVDFISSPVVLGYITGAGVLIGVGQLHNLTGTSGPSGKLWTTVGGWVSSLGAAEMPSVWMSLGTIALVLGMRVVSKRVGKKIPGAIVALTAGVIANLALGLEEKGLKVVSDLSPIPSGLPAITLPTLSGFSELVPVAIACTVLSLVESSAVARSIASRTGQRLNSSTEFVGQGLSNISAAFFGGYPVSGSLSRSALNESAGAKTRMAGIYTGILMVAVLMLLGPLLNHTPIASLAGILIIVAYDLVDQKKIKHTMLTSWADRVAFLATALGTWAMSLDKAIYLGVGISIVLYLRKARLLVVSELAVSDDGKLEEVPLGATLEGDGYIRHQNIRMLHLEGSLFFGAAGELQAALDRLVWDPEVKAIIVRMKRTQGIDATSAAVIEGAAELMRKKNKHLLLVGVTPEAREVLVGSGAAAAVGEANIFAARASWFEGLCAAWARALELLGDTNGAQLSLEGARIVLQKPMT